MHDERDRVHVGGGDAGDGVGDARAGGDEHDADLAGRARIGVRRVHRRLLMAHQQVLDRVLLEQLVVDRENRAAGISEDVLTP